MATAFGPHVLAVGARDGGGGGDEVVLSVSLVRSRAQLGRPNDRHRYFQAFFKVGVARTVDRRASQQSYLLLYCTTKDIKL